MKRMAKISLLAFLVAMGVNVSFEGPSYAGHLAPAPGPPITVGARIPPVMLMTLAAGVSTMDFSAIAVGSGTVVTGSMVISLTSRLPAAESIVVTAVSGGVNLVSGPLTIPVSRVTATTSAWAASAGPITVAAASTALSTTAATIATTSGNGVTAGSLDFSMTESAADVPSAVDYTATITITATNP